MRSARVLVLHSNIAPDAPPDELDTLVQADAIAHALESSGHRAIKVSYVDEEKALGALLRTHRADVIFNLVESIEGSGVLAARAPVLFERLATVYTGARATELALTCDKPKTKRLLRDAGLPTPDWSEPPEWPELCDDVRYIVKSALEDASLGLDDASVVQGREQVIRRAETCALRFGGRWFAERYIEGREFNVAVMDANGTPKVLPLAEMTFQEWRKDRPRIVGYTAKWHEESFEATKTVRQFGLEEREPGLADALCDLAKKTWRLLNLSGYARIDFRVGADALPTILEINPNPCLSPDAGFAAAAERAGLSYPMLIERILEAAMP